MIQIEKIYYFKWNTIINYKNILKNQDIKFLKLKDVPDRIIRLACYMAEILLGNEKEKN